MPLVRIDLRKGKSAEYRRAIADGVYQAMLEAINVPAGDRFQVITEHDAAGLIYDPSYLGVPRDDNFVMIQVTLNEGRSQALKSAFYKRIVDLLAANPGVEPRNVMVNLVDVPKGNWSFGNGVAQYAPDTPGA